MKTKPFLLIIIGLIFLATMFFLLIFEKNFYPSKILDTYEKCDSTCIKSGISYPCNCLEFQEKQSTTPLTYDGFIISSMILGIIFLIMGDTINK